MTKKAKRGQDSNRRPIPIDPRSRGLPGVPQFSDRIAELDLHGMTVEEMLPALMEFLNRSVRNGQLRVRVIHGKGTGVLRTEVVRFLSSHPLVSSFRPSDGRNGGDGATEVLLGDG